MDDNEDILDDYPMEETFGHDPSNTDADTFKQRTDPQKLLERYRLQLMNAYKVADEVKGDHGVTKTVFRIKCKKNTKPKANKQGVEDIISYLEKFINSHVVQGNLPTPEEYRLRLRHISNDLTVHFMAMRKDWDIPLNEIDAVISNAINIIDLFLTRTLFNEERIRFGESFKETVSKDIKPIRKENPFQKVASYLAGRR
ncbi:MAG: hypothetical protein KAU20_07815 [Nanoarchaeota archaeon]|nr:hypothetical protein [Nanoarchaeota archaeon]